MTQHVVGLCSETCTWSGIIVACTAVGQWWGHQLLAAAVTMGVVAVTESRPGRAWWVGSARLGSSRVAAFGDRNDARICPTIPKAQVARCAGRSVTRGIERAKERV